MPGTLFVVATPIGNLADLGPRALETLRAAAIVACEDTRTTQVLLSRNGVAARMVALHEHNEREASLSLLEALRGGADVAMVSDAGTPAVSDPGARLVEAAHRAEIRVVPIPGPNAAITAWSASGFASDRFLFLGFLPATRAARRRVLEAVDPACPLILYEAPHRVLETTEDLAARFGADREVAIARELTKKFEEISRLPLGEASAWLAAGPHRQQGEFVLVLGPGEAPRDPSAAEGERVLELLLDALPASEAAKLASRITGASKNALYRKALAAKK